MKFEKVANIRVKDQNVWPEFFAFNLLVPKRSAFSLIPCLKKSSGKKAVLENVHSPHTWGRSQRPEICTHQDWSSGGPDLLISTWQYSTTQLAEVRRSESWTFCWKWCYLKNPVTFRKIWLYLISILKEFMLLKRFTTGSYVLTDFLNPAR